ncbi:hypothetical protein A6P54_14865 [Bacillus sp. MKU004]|nr:hypothetical protein A6P54_14865 [Bacillus sp. MKU004]
MSLHFGIIGAGNGGHAFAAYLGMKEVEVNWFDIDPKVVEVINDQGGVYVDGQLNGFAPVRNATTDMEELIDSSDVLMVVAPANAHRIIARNCAPYLKDDQIVMLNPGSTGGALEFYQELKNNGCKADIILAETQSLLFACRLKKAGHVSIFGVKRYLPFATFPANKIESVYELLSPVFPEFRKGKNVLEISLGNVNAILHPAPSLFNLAHIEKQIPFLHYWEGITGGISNLLDEIDEERLNIGNAYQLSLPSTKDLLRSFYGVEGDTMEELVQNNQAYKTITGANSFSSRYFTEDIPMGLIPMQDLARAANVPTPTIDAIIQLSSSIFKDDFKNSARTLDKLGLSKMTLNEILQYVELGEAQQITNNQ